MDHADLDAELMKCLDKTYPYQSRAQRVAMLLESGADPNAFSTGSGGTVLSDCAFSRAVGVLCQDSITHLMRHGAVPLWHMDPRRAAISETESRCQLPIDPLVSVCEQLGFDMDAFSRTTPRAQREVTLSTKVARGEAIFMQLLKAYPEHIGAPDSRSGSPAVDAFLRALSNLGTFGHMTSVSNECAARVVVAGFAVLPDSSVILSRMGTGDFVGLPMCNWEWWQDSPGLARSVQHHSQVAMADRSKQALNSTTPLPQIAAGGRPRL